MTTQARPFLIADLDNEIREQIYDHVFASDGAEVGGVLVGDIDPTGKAEVHGMIPALEADGARASVTFTHEAWQSILEAQERDFPDSPVIVGWYHSHPGFGIFLSEHDIFIHRNFFRESFQLAYVVDPQDETEGIFGWRDGEVVLFEEGRTPRRRGKRRPTVVVDLDDIADDGVVGARATQTPLTVVPDSEPAPVTGGGEARRRSRVPLIALAIVMLVLAGAGVGLGLSGSGKSTVGSAATADQGTAGAVKTPSGRLSREKIAADRALVAQQGLAELRAQAAYEAALHPKKVSHYVPPQGPQGPAAVPSRPAVPAVPQTVVKPTPPISKPKGGGGSNTSPQIVQQVDPKG